MTVQKALTVLAGVTAALAVVVNSPVQAAASAHVRLTHVAMVGGHRGWGTTAHTVVRTSDDGTTWHTVFTVPRPKGLSGQQSFLFASDGADLAWTVVTSARGIWTYSTKNAGANWKPTFQYFTGSEEDSFTGQLIFADATHGWVLLHGGAAAGSAGHAILATVDGGNHWKRVEYQDIGTASPHAVPACNDVASNISFGSPKVGWITGLCGAGSSWRMVFRSTDGGHTWHKAKSRKPVKNLQYFSPGQVVVIGPQSEVMPVSVSSPGEFVLYRSSNTGLNWKPTTPIKVKGAYGGLGPTYLYGPYSAITSWVLTSPFTKQGSPRRVLWRTNNGAMSWQKVSGAPALNRFLQLDFVGPNTGFAVGSDGKLYVTGDSGHSWRAITPMLS